jgi:hypothetical protein
MKNKKLVRRLVSELYDKNNDVPDCMQLAECIVINNLNIELRNRNGDSFVRVIFTNNPNDLDFYDLWMTKEYTDKLKMKVRQLKIEGLA